MMTRRISAVAAYAAGAFAAHSTLAADMPPRFELPPPAILDPAPVSTWSGFYVGASAGAQISTHTWRTDSLQTPGVNTATLFNASTAKSSLNSTSFRPAGYVGYNFQISPTYVAGLEGDIGGPAYDTHKIQGVPGTFGGATALTQTGNADVTRSLIRWDGSVRARIGMLVSPSLLVYGTGGVAFASTRYGISCAGFFPAGSWCVNTAKESVSKTLTGWTFGLGADAMLGKSWIARAEYRLTDYGTRNLNFFATPASDTVNAKVSLRTHTFMVGIAYKFSDTAAPLLGSHVVSKY